MQRVYDTTPRMTAPSISDSNYDSDMNIRRGFFKRKWKAAKASVLTAFIAKYRKCVSSVKKCLQDNSEADYHRRRSHAKLHPLPDRKIRRVASNLKRTPTTELERLRKKGDDWTANDLFRFQYSDPEEGSPEERKQLCIEWLERLVKIQKKFCYLAWYATAVHACYYRLGPLLKDDEEKKKYWEEVKREYAEIFLMGRRIWRRPTHPSRLRVFYDMAVLCTRFGEVPDDQTITTFTQQLSDQDNFEFKMLSEIQFANSIDKVVRLENHVIDQFYSRRRSVGSRQGSFRRSFRGDVSPTREREQESERREKELCTNEVEKKTERRPLQRSVTLDNASSNSAPKPDVKKPGTSFDALPLSLDSDPTDTRKDRPKSILVPQIVVDGPDGARLSRQNSSRRGSTSRPVVRFQGAEESPSRKSSVCE